MAKVKKVKTTTWKASWKRVQGKPHQMQVVLRTEKLKPPALHALEVEELTQRVGQLEQMLAQTGAERDKLHKQIAEMELEKEAEKRCERTAVQGQLGHRAYLYRGMVAAAKQHILAERRVKELEVEVAVFKSVRVAS